MTTLYLIGGIILAVALGAWLAYLAGRASGRAEDAGEVASLKKDRDAALEGRDAAMRQAQAAANAAGDVDGAVAILKRHDAGG